MAATRRHAAPARRWRARHLLAMVAMLAFLVGVGLLSHEVHNRAAVNSVPAVPAANADSQLSPPSLASAAPARKTKIADGIGNPDFISRLHETAFAAGDSGTLARFGLSNKSDLTAAEVRQLRLRYRGRKFLFPLLDQGPNNQFLQFRVALAKAKQLNRTLVLPIWLPHNPRFLHLHPGAPATPSRDKFLDQVWYPFETAYDASALIGYVRYISLRDFRALLPGGDGPAAKLERCIGAHLDAESFESYLRLSRLSCASYVESPEKSSFSSSSEGHGKVRFLGFHLYDHDVGTRPKYFGYVRPSGAIAQHATRLVTSLFGSGDAAAPKYYAVHIRVADAHWEREDCRHTMKGVPVNSVSCGERSRAINHTTLANEIAVAVKRMKAVSASSDGSDGKDEADDEEEDDDEDDDDDSPDDDDPLLATKDDSAESDGGGGDGAFSPVYLASNLNCSDYRVLEMTSLLRPNGIELVCAQEELRRFSGRDNFVASLVEQEVCSNAFGFVGSRYSTWTDTVKGVRLRAERPEGTTLSFEELWAEGVR